MQTCQAELEIKTQRQRYSVTKADEVEMEIGVTDLKWNTALNYRNQTRSLVLLCLILLFQIHIVLVIVHISAYNKSMLAVDQ
jgi:hypothetical protein